MNNEKVVINREKKKKPFKRYIARESYYKLDNPSL